MKKNKIIMAFSIIAIGLLANKACYADDYNDGFIISPTGQSIILTPGETTTLTITVSNPSSATSDLNYSASISPFSIAEGNTDYSINSEIVTEYNRIVDWITIRNPIGKVAPNHNATITYDIAVPKDAAAGGQYATINVASVPNEDTQEGNVGISETMQIASLIYASVAGDTIKTGEISNFSIPSFILGGNVNVNSLVKNTGNTHQTAKYTMQVFPLFSDEELYTNEDNPSTMVIIPNQTYYNSSEWDKTPSIGIFKVRQTIEFAGEEVSNEKIVFLCPLWLLFVIIFGVILIIIWLASKNKSRKKK